MTTSIAAAIIAVWTYWTQGGCIDSGRSSYQSARREVLRIQGRAKVRDLQVNLAGHIVCTSILTLLNRPPSGKMMKDVRDKYVFNKKESEVLLDKVSRFD